MAEAGVQGFEFSIWDGVFAPSRITGGGDGTRSTRRSSRSSQSRGKEELAGMGATPGPVIAGSWRVPQGRHGEVGRILEESGVHPE